MAAHDRKHLASINKNNTFQIRPPHGAERANGHPTMGFR